MSKKSLSERVWRRLVAACFAFLAATATLSVVAAQPNALERSKPVSKNLATVALTIDGMPPDTALASVKIESMTLPSGRSIDDWRKGNVKLDELKLYLTIGTPFSVEFRHRGENWRIDGSVESCCDDTIVIDATLVHDAEAARKYSLIVRQGESASINLDSTNSVESASYWVGGAGSEPAGRSGMRFMFRAEQLLGTIPGVNEVGYRRMTRIEYPQSAIAENAQGVVYIGVHVTADGSVASAAVDNVLPEARTDLADAALAAVKTWTFDPLMVDGKPAASDTTVAIAFSLDPDNPLTVLPGVLNPVRVSPPQADKSVVVADEPASEDTRYRQMHPPKYPASAIRAHAQGKVVLKVHVDAQGRPVEANVFKTDPTDLSPDLGDAAIAAAMQWRFNPARKKGKAVDGWVLVPITFSLTDLQ